jgi:hypothetical protein
MKTFNQRPRTRGECGTQRPCPWVSCRYHSYLDVKPNGNIKINWHGAIEDMSDSCVLDLAEQPRERRDGEHRTGHSPHLTLDEVGAVFGIIRERARQIEYSALAKLESQLSAWRDL